MRSTASRRAAVLLAAAATTTTTPLRLAAITVQERSAQEILERQLYGAPPPTVRTFEQQVGDAISIRSIKGVWSLRESRGRAATTGKLTFRGAEIEDKGSCTYSGEAASGRGPWIIKSDGFGRNPQGDGGRIEMKALWKLKRAAEGTSYAYAGRITVGDRSNGVPDAYIEGDIVELVKGGKTKPGGSERKVGTFRADLERLLTPDEELAEAGGGGAALEMTCLASTDVRCR